MDDQDTMTFLGWPRHQAEFHEISIDPVRAWFYICVCL